MRLMLVFSVVLVLVAAGSSMAQISYGPNKLRNPSYEDGLTDWGTDSSAPDKYTEVHAQASVVYHGSMAACIPCVQYLGEWRIYGCGQYKYINPSPDTYYYTEIWVKTDGITQNRSVMRHELWNDSGPMYGVQIDLPPDNTQDWRRRSGIVKTPAASTGFDLMTFGNSCWFSQGGTIYLDNASLREILSPVTETAYEAEAQTLGAGASVATALAGYTGSGYVNLNADGEYVELTVVCASAAEKTISMRFDGSRYVHVAFNGATRSIRMLDQESSGWQLVNMSRDFVAGTNTFRVTHNNGTSAFCIDSLTILDPGGSPPPEPPDNMVATPQSSTEVALTWSDQSSDEDGFKLDRRESGTTPWVRIETTGPNDTSHDDTGLSASTKYYYKVKAYNGNGNSDYSNVDDATTLAGGGSVPDAPTNLTATAVSATQINLAWDDMSSDESGFRIDRRRSTVEPTWTIDFATVGADTSTFNDTGLASDSKYYYRVKAYNANGNSPSTTVADARTFIGEQELVSKGDTWRYRKGTAEASAPAGAWRERLYDDSGWSNGSAPVGYSGGGWPTGTEITDMQGNYMCVFLRCPFTVSDPALVEELSLDVEFDDGCLIWVNGQEVARPNMAGAAGGFQAYDTNAAVYVSGSSSNWTVTLTGGAIPALGTGNVVAVQAFNVGPNSSDLMMDLSLSVLLADLDPADDADGDVMPDGWENDKLGNTNENAAADGDSDRVTNIGEYIGGTHPANSNEFFAVTLAISNDNAYVSFDTIVANGEGYTDLTRYYALERKTLDGLSGWLAVPDYERVEATGAPVNYTNAIGVHPLLFRGRVWLE